jgi:hypothetical protein
MRLGLVDIKLRLGINRGELGKRTIFVEDNESGAVDFAGGSWAVLHVLV